jgi:phenylacetate-coenzyme A ligase PaaK-like adenylate-forming protein
MPTTLLPLGRKYFESGLSNVKSLIVCGELITNGTRRLLSHLWRTNDISELYGSVETMMLGFGSPQCEGVHAVSRGTFIELINPVTEEPARDYELGEIIVTTFRDLMPLIRYKLGDLGVVLPDRCVCGRMAPRYRVLGRTDSVFIAGSAIVFPVDIQAICDDHFAITGERVCRLIIDITRSPDETDILNIHVATHLDRFDMRTFVDYFRSSLAVVNADFGLALKNGAVLVNPASLKLNVAESRKVSLMVNDVRQHALIRHIEEQQYSQRQMRWARSSVEKAR